MPTSIVWPVPYQCSPISEVAVPSKLFEFALTRRPRVFAFFFAVPAATEIYTLSLHDALPISPRRSRRRGWLRAPKGAPGVDQRRSEEHTSELQSRGHIVCRLLLEQKKDVEHVGS